MQSANRLVAETQIVHVFVPLHSAVRLRLIVEFLDLQRCKRCQFDVPDARHDTALCEAIYTVDKERLENYFCTLTADEMKLVDQAVIVSLGLSVSTSYISAVPKELGEENNIVSINEPFGLKDAYRVLQKERDTLLAQKEIYEKICAAALPRWPKDIEVGE